MLRFEHNGGRIYETAGRLQPYAVKVPLRDAWQIHGFEATYDGALRRLAKAVDDRHMLRMLTDDGITLRAGRHRALAVPLGGAYRRLR